MYSLQILHQCGKRVKVQRFLGLIPTFVEAFLPQVHLSRSPWIVLKMHFQSFLLKWLIRRILKNLTMQGSWISYNVLSMKNMLITTNVMKFVIVLLIITRPEKWDIFVEITRITSLSWPNHIQEPLCKELVLEINL